MNSTRMWSWAVILCVFLAAVEVEAATYEQTVLADSPYGYWRFNETSGTTAINLGSSGAALNGNYAQFSPPDGVPVLGVAGIPGGGAGNYGARFVPNSQVYVPDPNQPTAYTIEAWVRPDSGANTDRNILVRTAGDPTGTFSHQLRLDGAGKPMHYSYSSTGSKWLSGTTTAAGEKWTHIVGTTASGNPADFKVYVNGLQEATWTGDMGTVWNGGSQWRIGSVAGGGTWFQGTIDEVAIYPAMLPANRILEHYVAGTTAAATLPPSVPAPSTWFKADALLGKSDGDAVTVWGDVSGNSRHATKTAAPLAPTYRASVPELGGLPAVHFDSTANNQFLNFDGSFLANTDYTVYVVEGRTSNRSNNYFIGGSNNNTNSQLIAGHRNDTAVTFAQYANDFDVGVPAFTSQQFEVSSFRFDSTWGKSISLNGQVVRTYGNLAGLTSFDGAAIGGRLGGYQGDVAEVIMYNHALNYTERSAVDQYLGSKYGLSMYGPNFGQAKAFSGPADLDLSGAMVYAIDASPNPAPSRVVNGATFTPDSTRGVALAANAAADNWGTRPEYGSSTDANNLEEMMHDIRYSINSPVTVDLDVVRGNTYKLQLLFSENFYSAPGQRPFDINIEGALAHKDFDPVFYREEWANFNKGAVYTATITAGDSKLNISLTPGSGPDKSPILNGFTLVEVAAKPIVPPIGNAHIRLHLGEEAGATTAVDAAFADGVQSGTWTSGTPTLNVPGIPANAGIDTAAQLNGTQQLTVMDAPQLTAYTLEAWVSPATLANMNILDRTSSNVGHISHELRMRADGVFEHYTFDGGMPTIAGTTVAQPGQWYYVVATATNGGRMKLFVNGQEEAEWGNLGTLWDGGDRWRIAGPAGGFGGFNGTMDEVSISNTAMGGDQVFLRYRNAVMPTVQRDPTPQAGNSIYKLDLADIVGHGNGLGTGTFMAGINPGTGSLVDAGDANPGNVTGPGFHAVPDLAFVDGVFIPGAGGYMQIATTGMTMQHNYPPRDGNSWDYFRDGPTGGVTSVLGGVDYASAGHSLIGMHANKGITFDLDAIRAAYGTDINQFTTTFGDVANGNGNVDFNVYLDGRLIYGIGGDLTAQKLQIPVGRERFLTILATDGGDSFSYDQVILGDPRLELAKNIAFGKPVGTTGIYSTQYAATHITDGRVNEEWNTPANAAFWLLPDGQLGSAIVDLEGEFLIGRIDLQNTHNASFMDRGTRDFLLLVSLDGETWTPVVDGMLSWFADGQAAHLNTPLESFEFEGVWARYVKFQVDSFYGAGAGLTELRVFEAVPEPATLGLLSLAAAGLARYVRRRRR